MKALKITAAVLVTLLAVVLIYASLQPSEYRIVREIEISAPPEAVFPHLNNSKKSSDWMPWEASDPQMKQTFSGPEEGVGATTSWTSTGPMGEGRCVVVESVPHQLVKSELTYFKPMQMTQTAELTITPSANGSKVSWAAMGYNSFPGRVMCLFMNMDKMVGKMFENGLTKLKTIVESSQPKIKIR